MKKRRKSALKGDDAQKSAQWGRSALYIGGPLALVAIVIAIFMARMPAYSDLDVIGTKPAIVQVYLPG